MWLPQCLTVILAAPSPARAPRGIWVPSLHGQLVVVPPKKSDGTQALLREALEGKAGEGQGAPSLPPTHTPGKTNTSRAASEAGKPPAAPGAQEGSVSVANATGPSWGVRSGCFRALQNSRGASSHSPRERGCVQLITHISPDGCRQEPRMLELAGPVVPNPGRV